MQYGSRAHTNWNSCIISLVYGTLVSDQWPHFSVVTCVTAYYRGSLSNMVSRNTDFGPTRFWFRNQKIHLTWISSARVSIVEFIVGNTVEFVNVTMNPTNSDKASENRKKKKSWRLMRIEPETSWFKGSILTIRPRLIVMLYSLKF